MVIFCESHLFPLLYYCFPLTSCLPEASASLQTLHTSWFLPPKSTARVLSCWYYPKLLCQPYPTARGRLCVCVCVHVSLCVPKCVRDRDCVFGQERWLIFPLMSGDFCWQSRVTPAMNLIIKKNISQQPLAISTPSNWRATSAPFLFQLVSQFYAHSIDGHKSLRMPAHM